MDPFAGLPDLHPLASALAALDGVAAVALGGSRVGGFFDEASDADLYAFVTRVPAREERTGAIRLIADGGEVESSDAWGPEDHFHLEGRLVEVMYFTLADLEAQVRAAHEGTLTGEGFTTALLYTVAAAGPLSDPRGELAALQARLAPYPEATRSRIIAGHREPLTTYLGHVRGGQRRGDLTMVTFRRASVQTLWFDVLFAINRRYHPGEKRLLDHAADLPLLPERAIERWREVSVMGADDPALPPALETLTADLYALA